MLFGMLIQVELKDLRWVIEKPVLQMSRYFLSVQISPMQLLQIFIQIFLCKFGAKTEGSKVTIITASVR
jgi:hypothetical protein